MNLYIILKLKEILKISIFIIILLFLLIFSENNLNCVSDSINIFLSKVFPSLFPFMLFMEIILNTNIINTISNLLGKYLNKLFNISSYGSIAIISGFLCGFPMGAKAVNLLYEEGKISKKDAYFLLKFTNNCNPAFILSTIGIGLFKNLKIGLLILVSHYLSSVIIGSFSNYIDNNLIIYDNKRNLKFLDKKSNKLHKKINLINEYNKTYYIKEKRRNNNSSNLNFMEKIKKAIFNTFSSLSLILGFIIIFNLINSSINLVLSKILVSNKLNALLSGFLEMTTGSYNIYWSDFSYIMKICLISFVLGFSGLSILAQIYSCISKHGFSFFTIFKYKLLQGILSFLITYILINIKNIFNLNYFNIFLISLLMLLLYILFHLIFCKSKKTVA